MNAGLSRREFLKASAATAGVMLTGSTLGAVESLAFGVAIPEVEKLTVTVVVDNYYESMRPSNHLVTRLSSPEIAVHAEHGLSFHIETVINGKQHAFMFDYGRDLHGVTQNINLLGLNMDKVEALGLSHGHLDHWGNLIRIAEGQNEWKSRGIPLYVGKEAFAKRYTRQGDKNVYIGQLVKEDIEKLNFVKIIEVAEPTQIVPGAYLTGDIARVTEYEKGSPSILIMRGGYIEHDSLPGEQSLIFNIRGKGLVVISSCAHAGIINTVRHAQKVTGINKIHAVMGGFHLIGAEPWLIEKTVADIKAANPDYIIPMHCAGFEASMVFAREMPRQFILNTAGAKYTFN